MRQEATLPLAIIAEIIGGKKKTTRKQDSNM